VSRQFIHDYRSDLDRIKAVSGARRESVLREAFKALLRRWGRGRDLLLVAEHSLITAKGNRIILDGALLNTMRLPFGYWEAKDVDDQLDRAIADKFRKGYPKDNILFSDDVTAVLFQRGHEVDRAPMDDVDALLRLLNRFFGYERPEVKDFREAVRKFAIDLPSILEALRDKIAEKRAASRAFKRTEDDFLRHAREAINPQVSADDVQEMLIQHILTEDIFAKVFDNPEFHRQNNVAAALYALEEKLFDYGEKQKLLKILGPYYASIASTAAVLDSHSEKQGFLKGLYENFYKVYNPKAADRLGVVYTPGEIVRFMIRAADWLCEQHFGKNLIDRGVEILDPATGTGTYIVELLDHFRGNPDKLRHKYKEELHANEVAILPYYVANLNIEASYAAITGQFAEYPNLCLVDTLDNVAGLGIYAGHQHDMFGAVSDENMARVKRQNQRTISVIIGNPPYNANQQNENDNNKNREYDQIDKRIQATYIKASTAQKTKMFDMYVRFFRWASDRIVEDGVLAFITNRSFIDAHMADGFRRIVAQDFAEGWIVDLGGDYKKKGVAGSGNVFGIGTGVAISFWIKRKGHAGKAKLAYLAAPPGRGEDKLAWLGGVSLGSGRWLTLPHREDAAWVDIPDNDWSALIPVGNKATKLGRARDNAIFKLFSPGVVTARDEWVYDFDRRSAERKAQLLVETYDATPSGAATFPDTLKWSRNLKRRHRARLREAWDQDRHVRSTYRPFTYKWLYQSDLFVDEQGQASKFFPIGGANEAIVFSDKGARAAFCVQGVGALPDLHYGASLDGFQYLPRYRYTASGERVDNITNWGLAQFTDHYGADAGITKDAIFAYCYAVLHDPVYRETYALNLKREFPRIPFYPDFAVWADWGQRLLNLHIHYEEVAPFALGRVETPSPNRADDAPPKAKLKSLPETGVIVIDEETQLTGIPPEAWLYRLGNRSGIDWVLDQHKEKTPKDPTIRALFNSYRFADYKESCITLLAKVVRVSVESVAITTAMQALDRTGWPLPAGSAGRAGADRA
jgi:predicted helicase